MNSTKAILLALVVIGLGAWSFTKNRTPVEKVEKKQPQVIAIDTKALEIFEKASEATAAARVFRYDAEYKSSRSEKLTSGHVAVDQIKQWTHVSLQQKAHTSSEPQRYEIATDGQTISLISHPDKKFTHGKFPDQATLLGQSNNIMLPALGDSNPYLDELDCGLTYEGKKNVGDVVCDVVYVKFDKRGKFARYYFGPDGLPQKIEHLSNVFDGVPQEQITVKTLTLSRMEVNPSLTMVDFQLSPPEGYENVNLDLQ